MNPLTELERQFLAAIAELHAIIGTVQHSLPWYDSLPVVGIVDIVGRADQVEPFANAGTQLIKRWGASKTDDERRALVIEAQALAVSSRQILHGGKGSTSIGDAIADEAGGLWKKAAAVGDSAKTALWLAGGLFAAVALLRR